MDNSSDDVTAFNQQSPRLSLKGSQKLHESNSLTEYSNWTKKFNIIYINLDKSLERRERMEQQLEEYGLQAERFSAIHTPFFGILGCGLSHIYALKMAQERKYQNVLILEDDFEFLVSKELFNHEMTRFFQEVDNKYDVCCLSYNLKKSEDCQYDFLLRALDTQSACGYLVNCNYYSKLIRNLTESIYHLINSNHEHWNYANDKFWKVLQTQDKWYCFKTAIGREIN